MLSYQASPRPTLPCVLVLHWSETFCIQNLLSWAYVCFFQKVSLQQLEVKLERADKRGKVDQESSRRKFQVDPAVKELIPRNPDYLPTNLSTISRDGLASVKLGKVLFEGGEKVQIS